MLFDLARDLNKAESGSQEQADLAGLLIKLGGVMGLLQLNPSDYLQSGAGDDDDVAEIERLIKVRNDSRAAKDWAAADGARDALTAMGVVLEDGPEGTSWRKA